MADKRALVDWDKKHVWHPFTQMAEWERDADVLVIERAEGPYLYDANGDRYLDAVSSLWVNIHGHNNARMNEALTGQLSRVAHSTLLGLANAPSILLAKRLAELLPAGLEKVFYSDNGSTAVEVAVKIAYLFWRYAADEDRPLFVKFDGSYHGDTLGAVSVGGIELFHSKFGKLCFETIQAPYPFCYRCPLGKSSGDCERECYAELEKLVAQNASQIAAVVIEPLVQCAAGIRIAPSGFLGFVEHVCRKHDVLLIVDEVATGFGRTGRMFAVEREGVAPDFVALAKGLTAGYLPLAATVTTKRVYDAFLGSYDELKTFFHGHTYTGNPLACAAALANIEMFEEQGVIESLPPKVEALSRGLERFRGLPMVGDVRQIGMIAGVELVKDRSTSEPFEPRQRVAHRVCRKARDYGIIARPLGDVLVFFPPLCCTTDEIEALCDGMFAATKDIAAELEQEAS